MLPWSSFTYFRFLDLAQLRRYSCILLLSVKVSAESSKSVLYANAFDSIFSFNGISVFEDFFPHAVNAKIKISIEEISVIYILFFKFSPPYNNREKLCKLPFDLS